MNIYIQYILQYVSPIELILLGCLLVVFCYQVYFYIRYIAGVNRRTRRAKRGKVATNEEQPAVSVVVCARNEGENLQNYLQALLSQDYPKFEVIVVNDCSVDNTQEVLDRYHQNYPTLHLTFVPSDANVFSTKKLALTLAAKAAKYDYLLLTDADCCPESPDWISEMMKGFTHGVEIVVGYGAYFGEKGVLNRLIKYDTLYNGLQYMGMALSRHPYMGVGRNLAYSKRIFFDNKGFAGMLDMRAGDDDLFVNKVCNRKNTNVICSPKSITWSIPKRNMSEWWIQKRRHLSVAPRYHFWSKLRLGLEPVTRGLFYGLLIAIGILGSKWSWIVAVALFLLRFLIQVLILNKSAHHFGERRFGLGIVCYDIVLPLVSAYILGIRPIFAHQKQVW